ncbi:hypothetical protein AZI86_09500 [Bdellovibrio bacteriovorus]|uniref:Lipoprotein n=1 Tax=Bdellovibrio bacteriovorus TaxID=959 RepID=A0A150WS19_BDEBC|nr:hypothetical protein [Bdellovibrio bacteriovorus]KYG67230.1 hypothetical protein AZI86_09500 [Bdellovibrio bacteriovorus]
MIRIILSQALLCAGLIACATKPTPYQSTGFANPEGYSEEMQAPRVYRVSFTGIGFSTAEMVEKLLHRRCAEITVREGYDWFTYYAKGRNDYVRTHQKTVPSMYGTIHLHKGEVGEDGFLANAILAEPLPEGVQEKK